MKTHTKKTLALTLALAGLASSPLMAQANGSYRGYTPYSPSPQASPAQGAYQPNVYDQGDFEFSAGHMFQDNRNYVSLKINGTLASNQMVNHKLGGELLYYSTTVDPTLDVDVETTTLALNYTIDYDPNSAASFYIGAGVGFQLHDLDSPFGVLDEDVTGFSQIFAGARFKISPDTTLNIGARRIFLEDLDLFGVTDIDTKHQWALEAGVTFRF